MPKGEVLPFRFLLLILILILLVSECEEPGIKSMSRMKRV